MSKRLTKTDFMVVYMILFSISFFIAGFFLGANVANNKAQEEFARYFTEPEEETEASNLQYSHTDFVSYHYHVYLPFKDFRRAYLEFYHEASNPSGDNLQALVNELRALIRKTKDDVTNAYVPSTSPLLQQSRQEYVRALLEMEAGINAIHSSGDREASSIRSKLNTQDFIKGQDHWLAAQTIFYEAIILWESMYITNESPDFIEQPVGYTQQQWNQLSFHQKTELVAKILEEKGIVSYFNPEDILVYIDTLVASSSSPSTQKIVDIIEILVSSGSVRQGEFLVRIHQYQGIDAPTIPLFSR